MSLYYLLAEDRTTPIPVDSNDRVAVAAWSVWFEVANNRIVASDEPAPGVHVSTVFIGIDHNHFRNNKPILWETMIFGVPGDEYQERYDSHEKALAGHAAAIRIAHERIMAFLDNKET